MTSEAYEGHRTASAMSAPTSSARSASPTIDGMPEKEKSDVDIEAKEQPSEPPTPTSTEDFPEGGLRAWSVVWGGFFAFIATFGVTNSYVGHSSHLLLQDSPYKYVPQGVFQDYYQSTLLSHSSSSTIALVGAIQLFFLYGGGPIIGRIYDAYGTSVCLILLVYATVNLNPCCNTGSDSTGVVPGCVLYDDALPGPA